MTEPIANDATPFAQPDAVDENITTTGAPIDGGDAYESITVPPASEQIEAGNRLAIQVEEAMYKVVDLELGVDIVDLSLVYDIWTEEGDTATTSVIPTSLACPLIDMLADQTAPEVTEIEGIHDSRLN